MNKGDIVRLKPNFHRPSRVGQIAKVVEVRKSGNRNKINQYFIVYDADGLPDWINEYDLELAELWTEEEIAEIKEDVKEDAELFEEEPIITNADAVKRENFAEMEEPQKRTLNL